MRNLWRIATTEAGLATGYFVARRLPMPDLANYTDHQDRPGRSDGGMARHGYKSVNLTWQNLSPKDAVKIRALVQEAIDSATGRLYLTIDRNDGTNVAPDFIDVYGYPHMPTFSSSTVLASARNGRRIFNSVSLLVNNLTIVNDPSEA